MARSDEHALLLSIDANIKSLETTLKKAEARVRAAAADMEKSGGRMESALGNPNIGRGLDNIVSDARQRALDAGAGRLGVFGGALEALGPAGLVAGAGIGAFSAALAGALAAAQYADELADTANKIHVTTDALQEYRYALRLAGGEEKGADQALEAFSVTLGKAQEGMARAQRGFINLGFSQPQIAAFRTSEEALTAVIEKLSEIESNPRRDALISLLGLDSMKPLITGGVEEMERLRAEARAVGVVMDEDLIQRGAELNDQFETLSQIIDVQVKSSLVGLAPVLIRLMDFAAQLAKMFSQMGAGLRTQVAGRALMTGLGEGAVRFASNLLPGGSNGLTVAMVRSLFNQAGGPSAIPAAPAAGAPTIPTSSEGLLDGLSGGRSASGRSRRAAGRPAQPLRAVEVFDPEILEILQALDYWQSVETRGNALRPTLDVSGDFIATLDEQLQSARDSTYDALYDGVRSGLEAGFYGGVPGMVDYLRSQLMRALMDSLAKTLAESVVGSGGGGSGGWIKSAVMSVLTGSFATGTSFAPGGMALVGERGPEVVNLPRGSTVTPHGIADIRPRGGAAPVVITADFRGAVVTEELMASFRDYADQVGAQAAAEGAARGAAEAQARIYTRARNRLGR
ncbi:hypothetical protein [Phenylobacterium sp.]|uniref:hypothetical protein n=1 Tax=Phenylobacterium sp. TaxID=1871053 RepID=UPI0025E6D385|nr:hypothetical protein [Phenylobacterium sp.]MCA6339013.1 hypothetical protein [Phenylobacterium sp.]MCA6346705.1 hypothetical protein [Phenylobacterium sp.]MCA6351763.1 hypothetical protein [Phenylobacterium sp.]MCA6355388.1 hypothetical protein [Phenylobacterium sp.]MCA6361140.1 hypothetical protein [Phenylobacterium sp.]